MNEDAMWYDKRVEAFIDGDLPDNEARLFAARLEIDPDLRTAVDQALMLQDSLQSIPEQTCPPGVTQQVLTETRAESWFGEWNWGSWAGAVALAGLLAVAVNLTGILAPGGPTEPSAQELAKARVELGVALAYLDRASSIAGREVGSQLVTEGFARPLSRGMNRTPAAPTEDAS